MVRIANMKGHHVLIDGGSSADILSHSAFKEMARGKERMRPSTMPIVGFGGEQLLPEGTIELPVTMGEDPYRMTHIVEFLVVKCRDPYNVILGMPTSHRFKAVASTYHQLLKFLTTSGMGVVKGEQDVSRECYRTTMKWLGSS